MDIEIAFKENLRKISPALSSNVSWDRLLPYIEQAVGKKPNEEVVGLLVNENGIRVQIDYKK